MTREEQILNKAIDYSEIEENFLEYDDCGDVCDDKTFIEKAFIEGAKWADEHLNLYNNEKYHTVKVSCLDELNRKAVLYDTFIEKACNWLEVQLDRFKLGDNKIKVDFVDKENFIDLFKKAMEE